MSGFMSRRRRGAAHLLHRSGAGAYKEVFRRDRAWGWNSLFSNEWRHLI
jgi:hypothetical protein